MKPFSPFGWTPEDIGRLCHTIVYPHYAPMQALFVTRVISEPSTLYHGKVDVTKVIGINRKGAQVELQGCAIAGWLDSLIADHQKKIETHRCLRTQVWNEGVKRREVR